MIEKKAEMIISKLTEMDALKYKKAMGYLNFGRHIVEKLYVV